MEIVFSLPHVFHIGASRVDNAAALKTLLECLVNLNLAYLRSMKRQGHTVPTLYSSGVVYARTTWWETIPALYKRGFGDCKSLTCAKVAEDIMRGIEAQPVFRFNPMPTSTDYHILEALPGRNPPYEDPSKVLGMGKDEAQYFRI